MTHPRAHRSTRRLRGFTLLEMLAAVAVAGVLSGIAYPSFTSALHKARRTDAITALLKVEMAQERHAASASRYATDLSAIGLATQSPQQHYSVSIASASATGYEAVAEGIGAQASDPRCRFMRLKVEGATVTQASGADATTANLATENRRCWNV